MKTKWKKKDAVSPVIATILMVAITVVLAAVLYVMVIGFGASDSNTTPVGSFLSVEAVNSTTMTIKFGKFEPAPAPMDVKVILSASGMADVEIYCTSQPTAATINMAVSSSGPVNVTATYNDFNYEGNTINSGDFLMVSGLTSNKLFELSVYHIPSESICTLTGDKGFLTPTG
jgi:flagellin-like protein